MKQFLIVAAVLVFLTTTGCQNPITFNQPQPEGVDSLTVLPKRLFGHYVGKDGASSLDIDRNFIVQHYDYEVKMLRDSLDWESLTREEKARYRLEGDSVVEHVVDADTLFRFGPDHVMKKYKGYYFLNTRQDESSWFVQKLELRKGVLTLGSIQTREELKNLEKINESPIDTTTYRLRFTRRQFHEYIDDNAFLDVDTFVRIKNR